MIEIASHPDDLYIVVAQPKGYLGKYVTNFMRGKGHRYKPLLTCDREEAFVNSREAALARVKQILTSESVSAFYQANAPISFEEFVACTKNAGYTEEWLSNEWLTTAYKNLSERGVLPILSGMLDPKRILNAAMIAEIIERFTPQDVTSVDTSSNPLQSFPGPPTC